MILIEKYMQDETQSSLTDYKFYCFDGKPAFLYVSSGLEDHSTARISFLTLNWKFEPFRRSDYKPFDTLPVKPSRFDEMIKIAQILSKGFPFLRVDLYEINGQVYFSELTFSPNSGMMPFLPEEYDTIVGENIHLPI